MKTQHHIAVAACVVELLCSPVALAVPTVLFDAADGRVLYAEDLDQQWHPASLTKIMTAYVVFGAIRDGLLKLETAISCSETASSQGPTKIGLPAGNTIPLESALQALIMESANDAAVMLAEAVAGSHEAFVEQMNATAARLNMTRTRFANANGLPAPEQVTTARDLGRLATAVVHHYPQYSHFWSMQSAQAGRRRFRTHNGLLLTYAGADGMKTGFICDSGFNIVASATREHHKLIAVVLGERTKSGRSVRTANLLEHGFMTREWKKLFQSYTLETFPLAEDVEGPLAMRGKVISWVCGTARRPQDERKKVEDTAPVRARNEAWSPW
jgi:D-alanyl-D-alanine carboxypeptidase